MCLGVKNNVQPLQLKRLRMKLLYDKRFIIEFQFGVLYLCNYINVSLQLQDKNGIIDKDELRNLFCDVFPGFHKYVYLILYILVIFKQLPNSVSIERPPRPHAQHV